MSGLSIGLLWSRWLVARTLPDGGRSRRFAQVRIPAEAARLGLVVRLKRSAPR